LAATAVNVALCVTPAGSTVAVKKAFVAFAGTVRDAGTVTLGLLLEMDTISPPLGAAAFSVTVQESLPKPVTEALAQESVLNAVPVVAGVPVVGDPVSLELPLPPEFTK